MTKTLHTLKVANGFFDALLDGRKPFEVRRNDRAFQTGDFLRLRELEKGYTDYFTGRDAFFEVTYLLQGGQYGVEAGFCVLGIKGVSKGLAETRTSYSAQGGD